MPPQKYKCFKQILLKTLYCEVKAKVIRNHSSSPSLTVSVCLALCQTTYIGFIVFFHLFPALQLQVCITYSSSLKEPFLKLLGCIFEGVTKIYCCNKLRHVQYHSASMAMAFKPSSSCSTLPSYS